MTHWIASCDEFVKRAGFALMAALAVHDRQTADEAFLSLLPQIEAAGVDDRNFVKKAVNWALRQIGKRNLVLNAAARRTASTMAGSQIGSKRWIGKDALRELQFDGSISELRTRENLLRGRQSERVKKA